MSLLDRILTCVDKIIPGLHNDSTSTWEKVTEEGKKALREELKKGSERQKEAPDSTWMSASLHEKGSNDGTG